MRWDALRLDADEPGALPGMPSVRGLLRTVQVPEFPGLTFHEVRARTALNRVPGESAVPFAWTINPYRGCSHACSSCLSGDTMIVMETVGSGRSPTVASVTGSSARRSAERTDTTSRPMFWRTGPPSSLLTA